MRKLNLNTGAVEDGNAKGSNNKRHKSVAKAKTDAPQVLTNPLGLGKLCDVATKSIVVGEWHRKNLGDLDGLAQSMHEVGLLQPIILDPTHRLVGGYRRLQAAKELGWTSIPCRILDLEDPLIATAVEDADRKPLTATEKYAVVEALAALAKNEDWRLRAFGGRLNEAHDGGRLDEFLAKRVGMNRESLRQMRAVLDAAREDPASYGSIARDLDEDGRINRHFKRLRLRQAAISKESAAIYIVRPGWSTNAKVHFRLPRLLRGALQGKRPAVAIVPSKVVHLCETVDALRRSGFAWSHTCMGGKDLEKCWVLATAGAQQSEAESWREFCRGGFDSIAAAAEPLESVTFVDLVELVRESAEDSPQDELDGGSESTEEAPSGNG